MHGGMGHRFVSSIRDRTIDVGDTGAHEILRLAHFQISKLQVGAIRMRRGWPFRRSTGQQGDNGYHYNNNHDSDKNRAQVRFALRFAKRSWFDQPAHEAIVEC